jgi:hypothetical protein
MISTLFRQPLLPLFGELVHVLFGHGDERADFVKDRGIFLQVDFVDEEFDGSITPFVNLLGEQKLHVTAAEIS